MPSQRTSCLQPQCIQIRSDVRNGWEVDTSVLEMPLAFSRRSESAADRAAKRCGSMDKETQLRELKDYVRRAQRVVREYLPPDSGKSKEWLIS
jgi:hypothetical protein